MRRHLIVFAIVAGGVFGIGYLVFITFLSEESPEADSHLPSVEPAPPVVREEPTPPVPVARKHVTVVSTLGRVERKGPSEAGWRPVTPGDHLASEETVKTAPDASARLQVDEKSRIELTGRSELRVREISDTVHRYKLVRGRISVDYDTEGTRLIRVESEESDAVAETGAGRFTLQNSAGVVSVATATGEVRLTAKSRSITVPAGKASTVAPGEEPRPVSEIPLAVMLRVATPEKLRQRERFTFVHGATNAGARVFVNGVQAEVDSRGRFRQRVSLREGRNRIRVMAEDVAGNRKVHELPVVIVDASAPVDRMDIRWGKEDEPG